jgi:SAM-dependent methyltransferase
MSNAGLPSSSRTPEHVQVLSRLGGVEFPPAWYDLVAQDHFWFEWRFAVVQRLFVTLGLDVRTPARAVDIGCGVGLLREQIESLTAWNVDGVDLNHDALTRARPGRGRLFYYNIFEQHQQFLEAFDYMFLFDVLEHIRDTGPFVDSLVWHLRPGGMLFLNVPALEVLRGEYDTAAGHYRRYNIGTLSREFAGRAVQIRDCRYWGFSAVPLVVARKLIIGRGQDAAQVIRRGLHPPRPWINRALARLARLETALLRRPPFGTSVLMAVCKTS